MGCGIKASLRAGACRGESKILLSAWTTDTDLKCVESYSQDSQHRMPQQAARQFL
jgi:hypothetical protein